jgi:beta-lactamase class A
MHIKNNLVNIEQKHNCTIGLQAYDFDTKHIFFAYHEHEQKIAASSIKLFFAGAVLQALHEKKLSLESVLPVESSQLVQGISILADFTVEDMSVRNLLYLLLTHSDTSAQNTLEQVVTPEEVNSYIQSLGLTQTHFVSKYTSTETHLSHTTPSDVVIFMQKLWNKEVGTQDDSALLLSFLAQSRMTHFGLRHLPTSLAMSKPIITERYSKAGKIYKSLNDSLIVKTDKGVLGVGVFIDNLTVVDKFNSVDHEGILLIASLVKTIFDNWHQSKIAQKV